MLHPHTGHPVWGARGWEAGLAERDIMSWREQPRGPTLPHVSIPFFLLSKSCWLLPLGSLQLHPGSVLSAFSLSLSFMSSPLWLSSGSLCLWVVSSPSPVPRSVCPPGLCPLWLPIFSLPAPPPYKVCLDSAVQSRAFHPQGPDPNTMLSLSWGFWAKWRQGHECSSPPSPVHFCWPLIVLVCRWVLPPLPHPPHASTHIHTHSHTQQPHQLQSQLTIQGEQEALPPSSLVSLF